MVEVLPACQARQGRDQRHREALRALRGRGAYYIEHAIVVPTFISGGTYCATKLNAFEGQFAMMGQASSRYKGQHLYKTAMTQEMFDEQYEAWFAAIGN